jgi:hypothetical protein
MVPGVALLISGIFPLKQFDHILECPVQTDEIETGIRYRDDTADFLEHCLGVGHVDQVFIFFHKIFLCCRAFPGTALLERHAGARCERMKIPRKVLLNLGAEDGITLQGNLQSVELNIQDRTGDPIRKSLIYEVKTPSFDIGLGKRAEEGGGGLGAQSVGPAP